MGSHSLRQRLAGAAIAALLTSSATAGPSPSTGTACLANVVSDLSCADPSVMTSCMAAEMVDARLLAACLDAAGCAGDEADETALWITRMCQQEDNSAQQPGSEGELRRRRFHARGNDKRQAADSTTTSGATSTTSAAAATSTSSYAGIDIGLSSAIVGSVMGIAAFLGIGGVLVSAWMESAARKKAKREQVQRQALMSNIG
ncbi:hypothetical protein KVR01_010595 [Diaporthe batatas]|uniref:uncharacterized protein n=1 Tax=Diaporthe batatas TaxID=748121 RepID=UPI001D052BDB|nr:uncharacterized protein KVR01_010595 [Diaporthe batatas]KAG8159958.1 hypothetical protein KVR01_010595 [Diaporthe batatas]